MTEKLIPVSLTELAEGVGLLVAAGFVVSLVYDWGFFTALGLNPQMFPMTIADHFSTALLWLPSLLAISLFYVAGEFQFRRVERGLTEQEIAQSSQNRKALRRFREWPYLLLKWVAVFGLIFYICLGAPLPSIFVAVAWIAFAEWCYSAPLIKLRRNKAVQLLFTFVPAIGLIAYFSGLNEGNNRRQIAERIVTIERMNESTALRGKMLRILEGGALILQDDKVTFLPWDQIKLIQSDKLAVPFRGILCEWFSICPKDNNIAPTEAKNPGQ
jgi:hypothetical protein